VSKSPKSPDRGNDKKAHGKPASASASANLLATFHVLDAEQIPLLSLGVLEQAARAAGGHLKHSTCSETNTATLVLKFPNEQFVLRARREHGYPVVRGDVSPDG